MEIHKLWTDLLFILLDFKKFLVCQSIQTLCFLEIENFRQHRHINDLICFNARKYDFAALYSKFVFVLHIEKGKNFLGIVLVFCKPVPELSRAFFFHYPIICSPRGTNPSLSYDTFFLHHSPS